VCIFNLVTFYNDNNGMWELCAHGTKIKDSTLEHIIISI
jgi:hypothetical protein